VLDAWELLGATEVAQQSGSGNDDKAKGESPDLALTKQLGFEADGDRDQYHAGEDQKASIAL
jgi:hypothetical protein